MTTEGAAFLLEKGGLGLAVLILCGVVVFLFRENRQLNERLLAERERLIQGTQKSQDTVQVSSAALRENNALMSLLLSSQKQKAD